MSVETDGADRELRVEARVEAHPDRVWRVLSDLGRMREWSPETMAMLPLKRGGLRVGQWYLGLNRRGVVVWPTRSVVGVLTPGRALAWDTRSSGARWVWELEPTEGGRATRVVHRRPVPGAVPWTARAFSRLLLGGREGHADELEAGMAVTLDRLKSAVGEQGSVTRGRVGPGG